MACQVSSLSCTKYANFRWTEPSCALKIPEVIQRLTIFLPSPHSPRSSRFHSFFSPSFISDENLNLSLRFRDLNYKSRDKSYANLLLTFHFSETQIFSFVLAAKASFFRMIFCRSAIASFRSRLVVHKFHWWSPLSLQHRDSFPVNVGRRRIMKFRYSKKLRLQ